MHRAINCFSTPHTVSNILLPHCVDCGWSVYLDRFKDAGPSSDHIFNDQAAISSHHMTLNQLLRSIVLRFLSSHQHRLIVVGWNQLKNINHRVLNCNAHAAVTVQHIQVAPQRSQTIPRNHILLPLRNTHDAPQGHCKNMMSSTTPQVHNVIVTLVTPPELN